MKKTKNLCDFLKRRKMVSKVVEDHQARESICSTISEHINPTEECQIDFFDVVSSDVASSDLMSSDVFGDVMRSDVSGNVVKSDISTKDLVKNEVIKSDISTKDIPTKDISTKDISTKDLVKNEVIKSDISTKDIPTKDISTKDLVKNEVIKSDISTEDLVKNEVIKSDISTEDRINKIKQFSRADIPLDYSKIETYLVLPKTYLRLSKIFKALLTVQKYNSLRKLTSIFIKAKGSIEKILKTRVEEEDIKRIFYLLPEHLEIKRITVEEKGECVSTFTFKILCTAEEMDKRLLEYYKRENNKEDGNIPTKEFDGSSSNIIKEDVKKIPVIERGLSATKKENVPIFCGSILERIKERERLRKEEFINEMKKKNEKRDLIKRIEILFKKESKRAMKIAEVVKVLEIYDGINLIKKIVNENETFEIKKISGEEHLVLRTCV
ncbi:Activating transcription factor 7-interacting protein 1 [Nosema granulosis]|uniref:Activating transcription factor 7-interacting protein 1 n=1 Tax=Nosema granulosis TaxID=83296 RepID=A0A9P6H247_9MICR|nr:Activating transcription factor 7-interacting protein 1 [Nosema granulosis]